MSRKYSKFNKKWTHISPQTDIAKVKGEIAVSTEFCLKLYLANWGDQKHQFYWILINNSATDY